MRGNFTPVTSVSIVLVAVLAAAPALAGPPTGALALLPGYTVSQVNVYDEGLRPFLFRFPTSLAFRGDDLIVIEGGRSHFELPYDGQTAGRLYEIDLNPIGPAGQASVLARFLADPIGLVVAPDGTVYFTQYGVVSRLGVDGVEPFSAGYPPQQPDTTYLPGSDENTFHQTLEALGQAELQDFMTTGTMGLAFLPNGDFVGTQGLNGRPPDDIIVSDVTGKDDYGTPFSSSILHIREGNVSADDYIARGCRNCFDLAVAPEGSPYAGRLFATENSDFYRGRIERGTGRSAIEGSTLADTEGLDGVVEILLPASGARGPPADHDSPGRGDERSQERRRDDERGHRNEAEPGLGRIRKVATFLPTGPTLGAVPVGITFIPPEFSQTWAGLPLVAVFAGDIAPVVPTRGFVAIVVPDNITGIGAVIPIVTNLANPIDVAFDAHGNLFVLEYSGRLYKVSPPAGG